MNVYLRTFLLSLLTPGLGYLQNGDRKSFCKTIGLFFLVLALSVFLGFTARFSGIVFLTLSLASIYLFASMDATRRAGSTSNRIKAASYLKALFVLSFFLVTGLSFANRRVVMGFDIMSMQVPVMEPTLMPGDKFLIDTWIYKRSLPKRGDIIAHTFNGQRGTYLNRIIAIEKDRIEIRNGIVSINGEVLNEPSVLPVNVKKQPSQFMNSIIIPRGQYFVVGDNRDASFGDSRFSGTITINNIIGKATDIVSSPNKSRTGITLN